MAWITICLLVFADNSEATSNRHSLSTFVAQTNFQEPEPYATTDILRAEKEKLQQTHHYAVNIDPESILHSNTVVLLLLDGISSATLVSQGWMKNLLSYSICKMITITIICLLLLLLLCLLFCYECSSQIWLLVNRWWVLFSYFRNEAIF